MNWEQVSANWERYKGIFKEKWNFLTDDDLNLVAGDFDRLVGRLEFRYGVSKDRAREWLDAFVRGMGKVA